MVRTLHHRARNVITEEEDRVLEVVHVTCAFRQCGYSNWAVKRCAASPKEKDGTWQRETDSVKDTNRKVLVGLPYIKGLRGAEDDL